MKIGILLALAVLALVSVVSADLPSPIHGSLSWHSADDAFPNYVDVLVTSPTDNTDLPAVSYPGFCVDEPLSIWVNSQYDWDVYSSIDLVTYPGKTVDWNRVNYVLNHKNGAKWPAVQAAVWHFADPYTFPSGWLTDSGQNQWYPEIGAQYNALITDAQTNGGSFKPDCSDSSHNKYAIMLYATNGPAGTTYPYQRIFLEKDLPPCTSAPEFPTLALPVAMLIGVVGVVYVIRGREK